MNRSTLPYLTLSAASPPSASISLSETLSVEDMATLLANHQTPSASSQLTPKDHLSTSHLSYVPPYTIFGHTMHHNASKLQKHSFSDSRSCSPISKKSHRRPHLPAEKDAARRAEKIAADCVDPGRNTPNRFKCKEPGCDKAFLRRYNLKVHTRKHTNETPYGCKLPGCGKRFKWRSSIAHHQKSHQRFNEENVSTSKRPIALAPPSPVSELQAEYVLQTGEMLSPPSIASDKQLREVEEEKKGPEALFLECSSMEAAIDFEIEDKPGTLVFGELFSQHDEI